MITLTACFEGGAIEVYRVSPDDCGQAVAELEDLPDLVSVGIKPDEEEA